jgi:hypothetical protein
MPEVFESIRSPDVDVDDRAIDGRATLTYTVLEAADSATASALVRAFAPLAIIAGAQTLVRQRVRTRPTGFDSWESDAEYGPEDDEQSKEPPQPGTWKLRFTTKGARHHRKFAKLLSKHWRSIGEGGFGDPPNISGAIEYDGERVNGVEVYVPSLKFQITAYYEPAAITMPFIKELARKTPRKNKDTWLTFDPGELLYLGGEGELDIPTMNGQRVQPVAIVHDFEASENRIVEVPELTEHHREPGVDGGPGGEIYVKGWDYFWIWFKKAVLSNQVAPTPAFAFTNELYDDLPFADFFGFGG